MNNLIYSKISNEIDCSFLDVNGDGRHFDLTVVSDVFVGLTQIVRQRMIYKILANDMDKIHALSMKLKTNEEYTQ